MRYRVQLPVLGRWAQRDLIGYLGDSANLYEYVGSEPISWADAQGLRREYRGGGGGAGAGAGGGGGGAAGTGGGAGAGLPGAAARGSASARLAMHRAARPFWNARRQLRNMGTEGKPTRSGSRRTSHRTVECEDAEKAAKDTWKKLTEGMKVEPKGGGVEVAQGGGHTLRFHRSTTGRTAGSPTITHSRDIGGHRSDIKVRFTQAP